MSDNANVEPDVNQEAPKSILESGNVGESGEIESTPWESFKSTLSDEFKNHPELNNYKDPDAFVKTFIHQNSMMGRKAMELPQDNWDDEKFSDFYSKAGKPEDASGYNLDIDPGIDLNSIGFEENVVEKLKGSFLEADLTDRQAKKMFKAMVENEALLQSEINKEVEAKLKQNVSELQTVFGDKYKDELRTTQEFLASKLSPEQQKRFYESGYGNDSILIQLLNGIAKDYKDDRIVDGVRQNDGFKSSETQAKEAFYSHLHDSDFQSKLSAKDPATQAKWSKIVDNFQKR